MLEDLFFLPEEFELPAMSPTTYRRIYGPLYPHFDDQLFERFLTEFELEAGRRLTRMSYGQRKKFLITFGLASGARLLLLDEPTNGLDIPSKRQFRRLVAEALTEERTFLISTHQVRDVQNLIDPIVILEEGTIVFNQDLYSVSDRLTVELRREEPNRPDALYWEKIPGGFTTIAARPPEAAPVSVDLELLFNAVVEDHGVRRLFASNATQEAR
jgi:ABC-2 type transport system ATP-binding protein